MKLFIMSLSLFFSVNLAIPNALLGLQMIGVPWSVYEIESRIDFLMDSICGEGIYKHDEAIEYGETIESFARVYSHGYAIISWEYGPFRQNSSFAIINEIICNEHASVDIESNVEEPAPVRNNKTQEYVKALVLTHLLESHSGRLEQDVPKIQYSVVRERYYRKHCLFPLKESHETVVEMKSGNLMSCMTSVYKLCVEAQMTPVGHNTICSK